MPDLITRAEPIRRLAERLPEGEPVALDCEFVRERTFWPRLGLIQLCAAGQILLIDPLALDDPGPLRSLLNGRVPVLMHAPGEDLECFLHHYGWAPEPLFDTQLAAAFTGHGTGLGYQALVRALLGVELDKSETRSDWLRRPLSPAQLAYAAADVEHLHALAGILAAELDAQGKRAWFEADCRQAVARARALIEAPDGRLSPRQVARLSPRVARRLQKILLWRERAARDHDRPRAWLLDNETCHRLAHLADGDRAAHDALIRQSQRAARFAADALWEALAQDPPLPPLPRPAERDEGLYRRQLKALQREVARIAAEHDLPPALLLPRKAIERFLDEGDWPEELGDWRKALLHAPLERVLASTR